MKKKLTLFCFLFSCALHSVPVSLMGEWELKEGKNLNETGLEGWIKSTSLPLNFVQLKSSSGCKLCTVTFRKKIQMSREDIQTRESLAVIFPYISNVFEVYWNGELLSSSGEIRDGRISVNGASLNYIVKIPDQNLRETNVLEVTAHGVNGDEIALYGAEDFNLDILSRQIDRRTERVTLMLAFLYLFIGLYHFLLYVKRTKEKYNLFFAFLASAISFYTFARTNMVQDLRLDPNLIIKFEYPSLFTLAASSVLFTEDFILGRLTKFGKTYLGFSLFISLFTLAVWDRIVYSYILQAWQMSVIFIFPYMIFRMVQGIFRKNMDAVRIFFGFITILAFATADLVGAMKLIPGFANPGLMKYGFLLYVSGIALVLANRFLRVHQEAEDLNLHLDEKVKEKTAQLEKRTDELQQTLDEVRALKMQQDGDYFLTSLLLQPLMINFIKEGPVYIDFIIKQKKTFEFKKKNYEIGGDICLADKIVLRKRNYSVFVNGDAMGKSIQGAGGALVLGVVFRAVLSRTKRKDNAYLLPEIWLKECFQELHNVFVSFDGSMLISVVLGLVDDDTGLMCYINAEHPYSVLYRDGKAEFMDSQLLLRKIGTTEMDGRLKVQTFRLQPFDVMVIGSDGRDDILLGIDENGQRIINEDEGKFLRHVEKGGGELKGIFDAVKASGELTDDLTLLKVEYRPEEKSNEQEKIVDFQLLDSAEKLFKEDRWRDYLHIAEKILEIDSIHKITLFRSGYASFFCKDFKSAVHFLESYVSFYPEDEEGFVFLGAAYKHSGKYREAADIGEIIRLRNPKHLKNLLNLADSYRLMGNFERSMKMISEVRILHPDNRTALEIETALQEHRK
ncbi:MAG TPA: SpoIIE family protein phosphatase [Leptospiraceae bacterium]|nr:SpoIIE family protein phosphatase [Leptospiraceae bacterium]HNF16544.1 SpoIIE family protein phosphatase [Leptospiraceae bacterium]HNN04881.1 SpoIIE family protein phosphatase [Leptospiraceae bacterium]